MQNTEYLYKNFDEYMEYAPFDKSHPNIEAFKIIWNMARVRTKKERGECPDYLKTGKKCPECKTGDELNYAHEWWCSNPKCGYFNNCPSADQEG